MKKHYEFIKISEKDMPNIRYMLIGDLNLRIPFIICCIALLVFVGISSYTLLFDSLFRTIVFSVALEFMLICLFASIRRLYAILHMHKSNLVNYIKLGLKDEHFFSEEIPEGFIIQTTPVQREDIRLCKEILEDDDSVLKHNHALTDYLFSCLASANNALVNKGVIYTEIILDQLSIGNRDISLSEDKLQNVIMSDISQKL